MDPAHGLGAALAAAVVFAGACSTSSARDRASVTPSSPLPTVTSSTPVSTSPYLTDAHWRRAGLVASLVNPTNDYSTLRLAHYDTGEAGDWSRLPEWNPRAETVAAAELDATGGVQAGAPLREDARPLDTKRELLALGEEAFFRYPVQLAKLSVALASRPAAARYGMWVDEARGAGGVVRAQMADGTRLLAFSCATCHVRQDPSGLVVGVGNDKLDIGRLLLDGSRAVPADTAQSYLAWGPGRVDVTTAAGTEPVRISDLRPTRWLTHLQHGGAVMQRDLEALATRIETLIITSNNMVLRPPRQITLALATYVWSLSSSVPVRMPSTAGEHHGATLFASQCARCHSGEGLTGRPVPLALVGTDPARGAASTRGTGGYRTPSLRGVASRGMLLHDASLPSVDAMLDPARLGAAYRGGRRKGPVPGHAFGLYLPAADRADLALFLRTL